ncbi:hypothetical protein DXG01_016443 [Tephrocybe rancida]|nr:hypothetical protein DXG01_016443 [Tephrocybe rancida]
MATENTGPAPAALNLDTTTSATEAPSSPQDILSSTRQALAGVMGLMDTSTSSTAGTSDVSSSKMPEDTTLDVSRTNMLTEVRDALVFAWCTMYYHATGRPYEDALMDLDPHT